MNAYSRFKGKDNRKPKRFSSLADLRHAMDNPVDGVQIFIGSKFKGFWQPSRIASQEDVDVLFILSDPDLKAETIAFLEKSGDHKILLEMLKSGTQFLRLDMFRKVLA